MDGWLIPCRRCRPAASLHAVSGSAKHMHVAAHASCVCVSFIPWVKYASTQTPVLSVVNVSFTRGVYSDDRHRLCGCQALVRALHSFVAVDCHRSSTVRVCMQKHTGQAKGSQCRKALMWRTKVVAFIVGCAAQS